MTAFLLALAGGYGVFLVYTALVFEWRGVGVGPSVATTRQRPQRVRTLLAQAGLDETRPIELIAVAVTLLLVGGCVGFALFGGVVPPLAAGAFAATLPFASARARRARHRARAREAWPRLLEAMRVLTGSVGRSIPQALFEVGRQAPAELQPAFEAARREWLITTDFARTVAVLKARLVDPTVDAACETLLVAHEVGGADLDRRLAALVEDRVQDLQGRKDAESKQAGVRFARRFVLIVPLGMAVAGLSIGDGRAAYRTGMGQLAVAVGVALLAGCWLWAGRIMRLPEEERVFL